MRRLSSVYWRLYNDFLRPQRHRELFALLMRFIDSGYQTCTVSEMYQRATRQEAIESHRLLILRIDVDSDLRTCRQMLRLVDTLHARASFFFRLSTVDVALMRAIASTNSEVGYHYEELSTLGKLRGARTADSLRSLLPAAKDLFASNLSKLREISQLPLTTAAAHGDWLNRRLGVSNTEILNDVRLRARLNIFSEAYDPLPGLSPSKYIDRGLPNSWDPYDPLADLQKGVPIVYLTLHPRQWGTNVLVNIKENIIRTYEGAAYSLRTIFRLF